MTRPVVAGTDFSPSGQAAVAYAAQIAARHEAPLQVIHAHPNPVLAYTGIGLAFPYASGDDVVVDWIDGQLKQTAEDLHHGPARLVQIDARRVSGNPASVLIDASHDALMTIVGCRGAGGFSELLLGSVSAQVAAHAHSPVIVIRPPVADGRAPLGPEQRPPAEPSGAVVAGYDGSPAAEAALHFAAAEAHLRGTGLTVATIYWTEPWADSDTQRHARTAAEQLAAKGAQACRDRYPSMQIQHHVVLNANPEHALTELSRNTALTVVGCRGRGGFAGLLLGSVSRTLVHHAYHPVAVIHPTEH